jgi:Kef-type K+ transport system membrane component KefB/nucleotide-binding universal stress UspA family protein
MAEGADSPTTGPGEASFDEVGVSRTPPKSRLVVFYAVLALVTAVVVAFVISEGQDKEGQPTIAGGYDAESPSTCLGSPPEPPGGRELPSTAPAQPLAAGPSFDVQQSGEFVNFTNTQGTLAAKLRLETAEGDETPRRLHGDVDCVKGGKAEFEGTATPGQRPRIEGRLTGDGIPPAEQGLAAELRRDPPEPGSPKPRAPSSIAGIFRLSPRSTCFGGTFEIEGEGPTYEVTAKEKELGELHYDDEKGIVTGDVECTRGGAAKVRGQAVDRNINNLQIIPLDEARPTEASSPGGTPPPLTTPSGLPPAGERVTATEQRESFGHTLASFFIAVAIVMLIARLFGIGAVKIGQPRVMGEVVAGIALGPTIFGAVTPDLQAQVFSTDILPAIGVVANLGLIFYMFLVGLELDPSQLKGRIGQAAAISNTSVALPMILGLAVALPIYDAVGPDTKFIGFALFMGVAMSITAFPVLARILVERRMLKRPVGAISLACAAIDDVTAWFLIALATAVAVAGSGSDVIVTIALAVAFCLVMGLLARPLLSRVSTAYDEAGRVPGGWIAAIFAGVLLSAFVTEEIGIAVIFGAFIMGMIMPRNAELTEDVTGRIEDFTVILLLPLFFAYTGLRTDIGLLDRPELLVMTLVLFAVAIVGKLFGAFIAARLTGFRSRASAVIGTLMNTRGLTELIVLNLALEKGVISDALFAMLVIMALATTFMAGPLLNRLDPKNTFGAPVEEELEEARKESSLQFPELEVPEHSILVAPQTAGGLSQLRGLADPLARSEPPRELILARLVLPPRGAASGVRGGLQTENKLLREASNEVNIARLELIEKGIAARAVAFTSPDPGADLARLARSEEVDLVVIDGRRPLLGEGVPRGEVGAVLEQAPCDVGVLVAREGDEVIPGEERAVVVPFGGAEHDWAALELGAWLASATRAPLKLLGAAGQTEEGKSATRLLGDAGLLVQQYAGISAEPVVAEPGREGIVKAASGAGLLVIGLSDRWRQEGLGPTRSEIARAAPAPVLFVRRGTRPGALAPREDVTRFTWSSPGAGQGYAPGGSIS